MRLIDADKLLLKIMDMEFFDGRDEGVFWNAVTEEHTVDAVKVIRCKDCVNYKWMFGGYCMRCEKISYPAPVNEDDFCSYGVRKDDSSEN